MQLRINMYVVYFLNVAGNKNNNRFKNPDSECYDTVRIKKKSYKNVGFQIDRNFFAKEL